MDGIKIKIPRDGVQLVGDKHLSHFGYGGNSSTRATFVVIIRWMSLENIYYLQAIYDCRSDLAEEFLKDRKKFNKTAEEFTKKHADKRPE